MDAITSNFKQFNLQRIVKMHSIENGRYIRFMIDCNLKLYNYYNLSLINTLYQKFHTLFDKICEEK